MLNEKSILARKRKQYFKEFFLYLFLKFKIA